MSDRCVVSQNKALYAPLAEIDPEVKNIIDKETWRQFSGLELIASEVRITEPAIVDGIDMTRRPEPDESGRHGGEWLHPHEQVLRGSPECAVLRW